MKTVPRLRERTNGMRRIPDCFGEDVFSEKVMEKYLPATVFRTLRRSIEEGRTLEEEAADAVAQAMMTWAVGRGATHYSHWFQPMNGITAEKHESFLIPAKGDAAALQFSGRELILGEPDASSFPSGGLRATFEARGYTAWDPTSYAFIKGDTLCIPTAFCSFSGSSLDKKAPLLRSMQALDREAVRLLRLLGMENVSSVTPTIGAEQEYFLIGRRLLEARRDLRLCGRTLFGAPPAKGQEPGGHYFGVIETRVASFMRELDESLWRLGVPARTEHNEAAPGQYELAPVYASANIACDHNQLTMEMMRTVAERHGMVCLLHEKPFEGVNGSGKHHNWSLCTDSGANLLSPGKTPYENTVFLLLVCAVLQAVDDYPELFRCAVASASNDCRLGGHEAPPAILSVSLGEDLTAVLRAFAAEEEPPARERGEVRLGACVLPRLPRDTADRNRTSPLAFTGNKFEFRMPGSSASVSDATVVLNTAVAQSLRQYADRLEASAADRRETAASLIRETVQKHGRILFNGNGYGAEWTAEAARRGLPALAATPDCLPFLLSEKNLSLFLRHGVLREEELRARYEVMAADYVRTAVTEAKTAAAMVRRDILPAVSRFTGHLAQNAEAARRCGCEAVYECEGVRTLSALTAEMIRRTDTLEAAVTQASAACNGQEAARFCRDRILPLMCGVRQTVDFAELRTERQAWPYPNYEDLLFGIG